MSEWISAKDRLPDGNDGKVLMTDGKRFYLASRAMVYKSATGLLRIPANYGNGATITHWMPLPKPPEEGKENA